MPAKITDSKKILILLKLVWRAMMMYPFLILTKGLWKISLNTLPHIN